MLKATFPATVPFILFPKQIELVCWIVDSWRAGEGGLIEKSRDSGMSWLNVSLAATLCLFHDGLVVGFGSRERSLRGFSERPKKPVFQGPHVHQKLTRRILKWLGLE